MRHYLFIIGQACLFTYELENLLFSNFSYVDDTKSFNHFFPS